MTATWQSHGACKGSDPDQYFPHPYVSHAQIASIRAMCEACPVRRECADWGIHHEQLGIWGGTTDRQRREIRRKLGIILDTPKPDRLYIGGRAKGEEEPPFPQKDKRERDQREKERSGQERDSSLARL